MPPKWAPILALIISTWTHLAALEASLAGGGVGDEKVKAPKVRGEAVKGEVGQGWVGVVLHRAMSGETR